MATGNWEFRKPSIHAELMEVDTSQLVTAEASLSGFFPGWQKETLVDQDGLPWRQEWSSRKQLQRGLFLVPFHSTAENQEHWVMPMDRETVVTPAPIPVAIKFTELQLLVMQHVKP